jgi:uncharacterized membrane protein YgcG
MRSRIALRFANLFSIASSPDRVSASQHIVARNSGWKLALSAMLALAPIAKLSAQQDNWPPDDETYNGGPQQQYAPSPQYSYAQPQYSYGPQGQPAQPYDQNYPQQGYGQQLGQAQPISPDQLTQLVAPIALYPDALVAQILAASTYPAQIAAADQWLRSMGNVAPEQVAAAANAQSNWDPSIKALTAFPQVLSWLAGNLQWTTTLGNAYYNQPQDVLQTIQVMRQRAEQAGNLQSTPQEEVTENQGAIDIAPTNPQVVYVPTYNPWAVYGAPVAPYPGFSFLGAIGSFFGASPVQFGLSFAMNAFLHTPCGFLGWGLDWLAHSVLFNHSGYSTHSASVRDWGFPHGGPRAHFGGAEYARAGYGRETNGWGHNNYASAYNRPAQQFNRGYGAGFNRPQNYGDARSAEGFNRGFPSRAEPSRLAPPAQMAYNNRYPQPLARSPQFENRQQSYDQRSYANPSYRAPENNYRGSTSRGYDAYRGNDFARSQSSGGSHFFSGHSSEGFGGKAPKSNFGGGHSSWGGGGGWKAPKESHSGGGHSGGHSSGGHSGHHH